MLCGLSLGTQNAAGLAPSCDGGALHFSPGLEANMDPSGSRLAMTNHPLYSTDEQRCLAKKGCCHAARPCALALSR